MILHVKVKEIRTTSRKRSKIKIEYSALLAAQVLDYSTTLRLVHRRAELMEEAAKVLQGLLRRTDRKANILGAEKSEDIERIVV